jgi:hypothetical protein
VQLKVDHGVITLVIGHYNQFLLSSEITEGMQHSIIKINRNTNEVANRQQFLALAISLAKQMCIILNVLCKVHSRTLIWAYFTPYLYHASK